MVAAREEAVPSPFVLGSEGGPHGVLTDADPDLGDRHPYLVGRSCSVLEESG